MPVLLERRIEKVEAGQAGLALHLSDGSRLHCDHVICATGYDLSVRRLKFLEPGLMLALRGRDGNCLVGRDFQTRAPDLYAIGPIVTDTFGPLLRFMTGAEYACPLLARRLAWKVRLRALRRTLADLAQIIGLRPVSRPA